MKNERFPYPTKYWVYMSALGLLVILLFVNIFVTVGLTGEKELCSFCQQDWFYFTIFLLTEIVTGLLVLLLAVKAGKLANTRQKQIDQYYFKELKYAGIDLVDFDYVWFDFSGVVRAKIVRKDDIFYLYVEAFDYKTESWSAVNTISAFRSLEEIKKVLFYEFDFSCSENTALDEYDNVVFRDSNP